MSRALYAVVSYVTGELGKFVDELRSQVAPAQAHLHAHLTILPPRPLLGSEQQAARTLARLCQGVKPVPVSFGQVCLFVPITPTVYIRIENGAAAICAMYAALNTAEFQTYEALPYLPHLTVAALSSDADAVRTAETVRRCWAEYNGPRFAMVSEITFAVDRELNNHWEDLATYALGG
jgi:2'-5' RNA ligase